MLVQGFLEESFDWGNENIIACELRVATFLGFLWVAVVVESSNFSNVGGCSFCNEGINVGDIAEESSDFSIFYIFFSNLVLLYSEDSSDHAVVKSIELVETLFGQVPWLTATE